MTGWDGNSRVSTVPGTGLGGALGPSVHIEHQWPLSREETILILTRPCARMPVWGSFSVPRHDLLQLSCHPHRFIRPPHTFIQAQMHSYTRSHTHTSMQLSPSESCRELHSPQTCHPPTLIYHLSCTMHTPQHFRDALYHPQMLVLCPEIIQAEQTAQG